MKKLLFFIYLLSSSISLHAAIGRHNMQINIGGGYHLGTFENPAFSFNAAEIPGYSPNYNGGAFTLELAYIFHSVRANGTVHAFNFIGDMTLDISYRQYATNFLYTLNHKSSRIAGGFTMGYSVGHQFQSGRLMFDIFGFGIKGGHTGIEAILDFNELIPIETIKGASGNYFGIQYVLPGIQYIMNNGFTIGWKNKLSFIAGTFAVAEPILGLDTFLTLGFTFGSGGKSSKPAISPSNI